MITSLFGGLAGIFKGFFNRAFWFASFMPVALATAIHVAVAALAFPNQVPITKWLHAATTDNLAIIPLVSAGLVVLAYGVGPLAPLALGILDASRLPLWIQRRLRKERLGLAFRANQTVAAARIVFEEYDAMLPTEINRMIEARKFGLVSGTVADRDQVDKAIRLAQKISSQMAKGELPTPEATRGAIGAMIGALRYDVAALPVKDGELAPSKALTRAQGSLVVAIMRARREAELQVALEQERFGPLATLSPPMATRLAEARRAAESYSAEVYGVEFDFIWPRLWLVTSEKDGSSDVVSDAQTQVDFSVMSVCLIFTVPLVWLPILALTATSPWLLLAVAAGGPLLCAFFYELAVQSQWRLAQVVKAVIDRYRIDLLKLLLQPQPATRFAERSLWRALQNDEDGGGGGDVIYRYVGP